MENFRPTKAVIDLGAIQRNTARLIEKYKGYQYYMAVVKADCYGYRGFDVVKAMLDGGANCLAASLLEEGLALREQFPTTPILLFTPVPLSQLQIMRDNSLWATVATQKQAEIASTVDGLQVVIRANGGSDILGGPTTPAEFHKLWDTLKNGKCNLKGIYLHSYNAECAEDTANEYLTFESMTAGLPLESLDLVSISNSLTLPRYGKKDYANACRLGNIVYRIESEDTELENTFSLTSRVLNVFTLKKGQSVAYSRAYTATEDNTYIASVPIGFGDGFSKTNIGRDVFINGKRYPIVAVTMDITHILVDDTVNADDEVVLIKDTHHLDEIAEHIHGATEEAICALNKRVTREYID